jgi:uncharacterized membrane protein
MLLFQLLLFFIQIWLFVMVLESLLDGHAPMAIPVAIASLIILAVNIWMLRGVNQLSNSR